MGPSRPEDTTEEKAQAEYRKIAERRVRLGLVLAQVGESADIKVSDEEVNQATQNALHDEPPAAHTAMRHLYSETVDPSSDRFSTPP